MTRRARDVHGGATGRLSVRGRQGVRMHCVARVRQDSAVLGAVCWLRPCCGATSRRRASAPMELDLATASAIRLPFLPGKAQAFAPAAAVTPQPPFPKLQARALRHTFFSPFFGVKAEMLRVRSFPLRLAGRAEADRRLLQRGTISLRQFRARAGRGLHPRARSRRRLTKDVQLFEHGQPRLLAEAWRVAGVARAAA